MVFSPLMFTNGSRYRSTGGPILAVCLWLVRFHNIQGIGDTSSVGADEGPDALKDVKQMGRHVIN